MKTVVPLILCLGIAASVVLLVRRDTAPVEITPGSASEAGKDSSELPPEITGWTNTKTGNQQLGFLVSQGEDIDFSITTSGAPDDFTWTVNGVDQSNDDPTFHFTIPSQNGIWRISAQTARRETITADGVGSYEDISLDIVYPDRVTWIVATTTTGTANVYYQASDQSIRIESGWTTPGHIAQCINNTSIIQEVSPKIWLVKKDIRVASGAQLYVSTIDTDEFRLLGESVDANILSSGFLCINDVVVKSWNTGIGNYENNDYGSSRPYILLKSNSTGELERNSIFGLSLIRIEWADGGSKFYHNTITDCWGGIYYVELDNLEICYNTLTEIWGGSIYNYHRQCNNILIF
ncbi:MAG: hypothetical protein KAV00_16420, partial [Phycisphaerae bacterium]|nr:hypothetical protein [Phycisphaerae bacterium]